MRLVLARMITARTLTQFIIGKALGITDDGVLMIEDESWKIHHVYSADMKFKRLQHFHDKEYLAIFSVFSYNSNNGRYP